MLLTQIFWNLINFIIWNLICFIICFMQIKLDTDHSKGQVDLRSENTEIKPEIAENQVKPQKFRDSFDVQGIVELIIIKLIVFFN